MNLEDAQDRFAELIDAKMEYLKARNRLATDISNAFEDVFHKRGSNPSLGILAMQESLERKLAAIDTEIQQLFDAIDNGTSSSS
jgi:hypothetical protein